MNVIIIILGLPLLFSKSATLLEFAFKSESFLLSFRLQVLSDFFLLQSEEFVFLFQFFFQV